MFFILLLIIATLLLAGSAAFFSVYGLAKIYTGLVVVGGFSFSLPISAGVIAGISIETGKLMAASYLYRYWHNTGVFLKCYLLAGIIVAMILTSVGVYGYLTASYQTDSIPLQETETKIQLMDDRKHDLETLKEELKERRIHLTKQVDDLPSNFGKYRENTRKQIQPEIDKINKDIKQYSEELQLIVEEQHKLKTELIHTKVHVGPIIYVARIFNQEVDDAINWLTLMIMSIFDPMAVALTICVNIALVKRGENNKKQVETIMIEDLQRQKKEIEESLTVLRTLATQVHQDASSSVDDLKSKLAELNKKDSLSDEEIKQKRELETMLSHSNKKEDILRKIRSKQS